MEYRITDNRGSLIAEASGDDALNLALETLAGETPSTHFATLFLVEAYDGAAVQPIRWYVYAAAGATPAASTPVNPEPRRVPFVSGWPAAA